MSVKLRLAAIAALSIATLAIISTFFYFSLSRLAGLQDDGFSKTQTQAAAIEANSLGAQFYQVFADAIINRDLVANRQAFEAIRKEALADFASLAEAAHTPEEKATVAEAQKAIERLIVMYDKRLLPALTARNTVASELRQIDGEADAEVATINEQLTKIAENVSREAADADAEFDALRGSSLRTAIIVSVVISAVLLAITLLLIRSIMGPLLEAREATRRVAEGDLSVVIEVKSRDEIGQMLSSIQTMVGKLAQVIGEVRTAADALSNA